jgi:hypothetical protein
MWNLPDLRKSRRLASSLLDDAFLSQRRIAYYLIDFHRGVSDLRSRPAELPSMKLSLRTKLVAVLVVAPVLLLLVAIGVIWTLDYRQRVAEQGGMFRSESIQVGRSLRLAVDGDDLTQWRGDVGAALL